MPESWQYLWNLCLQTTLRFCYHLLRCPSLDQSLWVKILESFLIAVLGNLDLEIPFPPAQTHYRHVRVPGRFFRVRENHLNTLNQLSLKLANLHRDNFLCRNTVPIKPIKSLPGLADHQAASHPFCLILNVDHVSIHPHTQILKAF